MPKEIQGKGDVWTLRDPGAFTFCLVPLCSSRELACSHEGPVKEPGP